jgi:hypothetical protein
MNREIDVRHVLPSIGVPTLVLYREHEYYKEQTPLMGEQIPGALIVAVPGNEHLPWEGDQQPLLNEIERFLKGVRDEAELDRVLATVLFTDIVGSTAKAAEMGDRAWRELLERHHTIVRGSLAGSAAAKLTPRATVSSRLSTALRGRSVAHAQSRKRCTSSASKSGRASTRARSSS